MVLRNKTGSAISTFRNSRFLNEFVPDRKKTPKKDAREKDTGKDAREKDAEMKDEKDGKAASPGPLAGWQPVPLRLAGWQPVRLPGSQPIRIRKKRNTFRLQLVVESGCFGLFG